MKRPRVLVVDDKPNFLALFRRIVGEEIELLTASDGSEALTSLAREAVDVVVSDVKMPGTDGIELLRQVKTLYPDIEVILMTAYAAVPDAVAAMKSGAIDYLTKPFDPDKALEAINEALARRRSREKQKEDEEPASAGAAQVIAVAEDAGSGASTSPDESQEPSSDLVTSDLVKLPYREVLAHSRDRSSKEYLTALLKEVRGNVTHAAERAGIERESLHRLLKKYGLRADDFRSK